MPGCADATPRCRKTRLFALLLPVGLLGCMQQQSGQPQSSGSAGAACAQEARRLGFNVLDVGAPVQAFDGSQDVQILVQWANGGATHIRCRYDRTYGVTLG